MVTQEQDVVHKQHIQERSTWKGKFSLVSPWFSDIISQIKQEVKSEHLSLDPTFVRKHFHGMPLHRITQEDIRAVYLREILAGQDQLAEFIANRWLFRNLVMYKFFEGQLEQVFANIEEIKQLEDDKALSIINEARTRFSIDDIFCFITLNEVQVSDEIYKELHKKALESLAERNKKQPENSLSDKEQFAAELKKVKEKYEKKIEELTRKHQVELSRVHQELRAAKQAKQEMKK